MFQDAPSSKMFHDFIQVPKCWDDLFVWDVFPRLGIPATKPGTQIEISITKTFQDQDFPEFPSSRDFPWIAAQTFTPLVLLQPISPKDPCTVHANLDLGCRPRVYLAPYSDPASNARTHRSSPHRSLNDPRLGKFVPPELEKMEGRVTPEPFNGFPERLGRGRAGASSNS